jgi:hypothetical protein
MDRLKSLLGMDNGRQEYHVMAGEVERAEFEYSQLMFNFLFDDQIGLIATLGPTWNMVNDPRFLKIENCFIRKRRAIFEYIGGDTTVGIQHISDSSGEERDSQSLEQYSTIIGEGRHFHKVIVNTKFTDEDGDPCHPKTFCQESDTTVWRLIRQECPNYFTREGRSNREATTLYNLFKEDLIGLIDDYAELPQVNEMVNSDSGEVYNAEQWDGETPIVNLEIDQLEKALNVRAHLRLTAWRILERLGFADKITAEQRLTDWERDALLFLIYSSHWPEDRTTLALEIQTFINNANSTPYREREVAQLNIASKASKNMIQEIKDGKRKVINQANDPGDTAESMDPEAAIILSIQSNPYKTDLFSIFVQAEERALTFGDKVCAKIVTLLQPVFESTNFDVNEEVFQRYIRQVRSIIDGQEHTLTTIEGILE